MLDKKEHYVKAKTFEGEGNAYVHIETRGFNSEVLVAGDSLAILCSIDSMIKRMTQLTDRTIDEILEAIKELDEMRDAPLKTEIKGEVTKYRDDSEQQLKEYRQEIKELRLKLDSTAFQLKLVKQNRDRRVKILNEKLQEKEKEILRLDHENDRLSNLIINGKTNS